MQVRGDAPHSGGPGKGAGGFRAGQLDLKERSAGMFLRALGRGCSRKPSEAEVVWGWSVPTSAKAAAVVSTNEGYPQVQRPEATLEDGWGWSRLGTRGSRGRRRLRAQPVPSGWRGNKDSRTAAPTPEPSRSSGPNGRVLELTFLCQSLS